MRKITLLVVVTFQFFIVLSQSTQYDSYKIEQDGYFSNLKAVKDGFIFTDNYASAIYFYKHGQVKTIHKSPSCGRYYQVSSNGESIGFKLIDEDGKQSPAILNLNDLKINLLDDAQTLCGQVFFSENSIVYSTGNTINLTKGEKKHKFEIENYSNYTPISPDGKFIVYNNENDQLFILDTETGISYQFTDNNVGYLYPLWSPDSKKLLYSDMTGILYLFDISNNLYKIIGQGSSPSWSDDSKKIIFHRSVVDDFVFYSSDIFEYNLITKQELNISKSEGINEMNPIYSEGKIIYHTYNKKQIIKSEINSGMLKNSQELYYNPEQLNINFYNTSKFLSNKAVKKIPGTVPYVHQVYDTPTWHIGSGSCAPTTSVMAFAYFNKLPKWPTSVDHGKSWDPHVNDYGSYVADRYRFREIYYEQTADAYGTTAYGGYGYMWTGSYSPNSRMRQYIENHGLSSNQLWTTSCSYTNTTTEIDLGYPHPICNYLTSSGHLTLTIGYVIGQHTLIFNDPYGNKNTPGYPSYDGQDAYYDWPGYNNGYQNLDAAGTHGYVAWTVKARGSEPAYNDTIIDDTYHNHGFFMYNQPSSHQRYYRSQLTGYNGHMWWTGTMATTPDICYTTWKPNIPQTGNYEVLAYIPANYANATGAKYKIYYNGGNTTVTVNQANYNDQWVSLGTFPFLQGQNGYVYLGDYTGVASENLAFDAVWFKKVQPQVQFSVSNVSCNGGSDGQISASPSAGQAPYTYLWSNGGNTQQITGLIAGIYSVTITDNNSQTYTSSATVTEPAVILSSSTIINPSSFGASDGQIFQTVSGGTSPYTYVWNPNVGTAGNVSGLTAGIYDVTITDSKSCTKSYSYELINPTCSKPTNITASNITAFSARINWTTASNAINYCVKHKKASESLWTFNYTTNNYFNISGLVPNQQYNYEVYSICDTDSSSTTVNNFTTLNISNTVVSDCYGKFTDSGGENGVYTNNENYTFTISPVGATKISITFSQFDVEANYDTLFVYDGSSTSASQIGAFTGVKQIFTLVSSGGSLTFKFKTDNSTVKNGWIANWLSYGGSCGNPATSIYNNNEWKTSDFQTAFLDEDINGNGLKSKFYQVLDFNGTDWSANKDYGFFNDNFQNNLNSSWTSTSGTWTLNSQHLNQTEQVNANTNIYTALNQDSLHSYLYHWQMKLDGTGSNRRAGIYIFSDNPALDQRGNAYMIYFRADQNKVQLYTAKNNAITIVTDDNCTVLPNVWYDYKVVYNPLTGELLAYQNNVLVSKFIDSNPVKNGTAISLRTGDCDAMYDDIKVYKSRNSYENVSLGDNYEVRYQNPNPTTNSCRIKSVILDSHNKFSDIDGGDFNIDWTIPDSILIVNDGLTNDIDTIFTLNELSANWSSSADANSDIKSYWYCIGTSPGSNNILDWIDNGQNTSATATALLTLTNNETYYFSVRAENNAGLFSNISFSDGQKAILNPEVLFYSDKITLCQGDTVHFINNSQYANSYLWEFEGGNPSSSNEIEPAVIYNNPGTYYVRLIAYGNNSTDTLTQESYLTVMQNPLSDFTCTTTNLYLPNAVALFTNNSSGASTYLWNFGDATNSTDENPYHIYTIAGTYNVELISYSNSCGNDTLLKNNYIVVNNPVGINSDFEDTRNVQFTIYPNPASDIIVLEYANDYIANTVEVFDNLGRKILDLNLSGKENKLIVKTNELTNGIYHYIVKDNDVIVYQNQFVIIK